MLKGCNGHGAWCSVGAVLKWAAFAIVLWRGGAFHPHAESAGEFV